MPRISAGSLRYVKKEDSFSVPCCNVQKARVPNITAGKKRWRECMTNGVAV